MNRKQLLASTLALAAAASAHANALVDFSDLSLAPNSYYDGGATENLAGFNSGGAHFALNQYGGYFDGYAYSNVNDTTTAGYTNQFAAITGTGVGGSGIYGIAYDSGRITLPNGQTPKSIQITNTTYADLSMKNGDQFTPRKFGGPDGTLPDFFNVTFTGYNAANAATGSVTFYLADYRAAGTANDYIVENWANVDLAPLGAAKSIGISFDGSVMSNGFLATPAYFAFDNLSLVPEPTTLALLAALPMIGRRRR